MAILYMLHVEECFKSDRPYLENGEIGVDMGRREALKRFTNWVPCICQASCTSEWNFANDIGFTRGGGQDCKISKLLGEGTMPSLFKSKELGWLKTMHMSWSNPNNRIC